MYIFVYLFIFLLEMCPSVSTLRTASCDKFCQITWQHSCYTWPCSLQKFEQKRLFGQKCSNLSPNHWAFCGKMLHNNPSEEQTSLIWGKVETKTSQAWAKCVAQRRFRTKPCWLKSFVSYEVATECALLQIDVAFSNTAAKERQDRIWITKLFNSTKYYSMWR